MYRAILNEIQSLIERGNGATESELKALWNKLSDTITQAEQFNTANIVGYYWLLPNGEVSNIINKDEVKKFTDTKIKEADSLGYKLMEIRENEKSTFTQLGHKKIDKWDAMIFFDEVDKLYTIMLNGKGGAITSDANLKEAERKFVEAMNVSDSVQKLLHFKEHGTLSQVSK